MKKIGVLFAAAMLVACGSDKDADKEAAEQNQDVEVSQEKEASSDKDVATDDDAVFYSLGYLAAGELLKSDEDFDADAFLDGFTHGMKEVDKKELRFSEDEMEGIISQYQEKKMQEMMAEQEGQQEKAQELAKEGEKFRKENAEKDGVKVTDSGLQYEVLEEGDGDTKPSENSTVKAHYHGTLVDGTVFDSSIDRGEPVDFPVDGVIEGWQEALQLMSEGDKWRIVLPPELAYGEQGAGGEVGPNATLIFEVELLEVSDD